MALKACVGALMPLAKTATKAAKINTLSAVIFMVISPTCRADTAFPLAATRICVPS